MPKPPLLARLLMSALRSQGGLRREVRQLNVHLAQLVQLKRLELGISTTGLPGMPAAPAEQPVGADPQVVALAELWRLETAERLTHEFRETYFRDPTETELLARVEAELGRGERGAVPVAAPSKFDFVEPPGPEREGAEL